MTGRISTSFCGSVCAILGRVIESIRSRSCGYGYTSASAAARCPAAPEGDVDRFSRSPDAGLRTVEFGDRMRRGRADPGRNVLHVILHREGQFFRLGRVDRAAGGAPRQQVAAGTVVLRKDLR